MLTAIFQVQYEIMDTVHTHTHVTHIYEYIFNPHTTLKMQLQPSVKTLIFFIFLKKNYQHSML